MRHASKIRRRLHFLQVEFTVVAFLDAAHLIYYGIAGLPSHFTFLHVHVRHTSTFWIIVALWLAYIAWLCREPSAALTVGGYISLAIAHVGSYYFATPPMYAPHWSVCLAGSGAGLLGIGFWFRIKRDRIAKEDPLKGIKMRQSPRLGRYELWQLLELLLIIVGIGFLIVRIVDAISK